MKGWGKYYFKDTLRDLASLVNNLVGQIDREVGMSMGLKDGWLEIKISDE